MIISQIDLIGDIMAALENRGVKRCNARQMNAVIEAANLIVDAIAKEHKPAIPGSGWRVWLQSDATGLSSKCLLAETMNVHVGPPGHLGVKNYPHDADDFGRCIGLLDAEPEIRGKLGVMADCGPQWAAIVQRWDELERLYRAGNRKRVNEILRVEK